MADKDTVQMTHPNGTTVRVRKEKVDRLLAMGFTKPTTRKSADDGK